MIDEAIINALNVIFSIGVLLIGALLLFAATEDE